MKAQAVPRQIEAAKWLLRIGLASVFGYAAIAATLNPVAWVGYLPAAATSVLGTALALKLFAMYQLVLAVWLLIGKWGRYAAGLAALTVVGILISNLAAWDVTFRDVAILFSACALALLS